MGKVYKRVLDTSSEDFALQRQPTETTGVKSFKNKQENKMKSLKTLILGTALVGASALAGCGNSNARDKSSDLALINSVFRKASGEDKVLQASETVELAKQIGIMDFPSTGTLEITLYDPARGDQFIAYGVGTISSTVVSRADLIRYLGGHKIKWNH